MKNKLGSNDQSKLDEYMTSLNQVEMQLVRNEKWLDIPMKEFDASLLNLDVDPTSAPQDNVQKYLLIYVLMGLVFLMN